MFKWIKRLYNGSEKADDANDEPYWNMIDRHEVSYREGGKTVTMELPLDAKIVYDEEKSQWKFKLAGAKRWTPAIEVRQYEEFLTE